MKIKSGILFCILSYGILSYADSSIVYRNNIKHNNSAIQFSNYTNKRQSGIIDYDNSLAEPIIKEIKKQIGHNPDNYSLYANLAEVYLKSKQFEQAYDNFAFLYKLKKNNKLDYDSINAVDKIFNTYKKSEKKESELYLNLAVMSLILDNNLSIDYLIAGIEKIKDCEFSKKAMQLIFDADENPQKTINDCDKILQKKPNNIQVRRFKAIYLVQTGDIKSAINEYTKILELNSKDDESRYELYRILSSAKNTDDKEILKRLYGMKEGFTYENAYVSLTELLLKNSDYEDAKYYASVIIKKYKDNPNSYILMSDIQKKEGKLNEAYETLSQARSKADDNETIAKYNVMLAKLSDEPIKEANSLIATGLYQQALDVLESANPDSLYVILTQARTYYLLGNKQKTFDLLNKAMSLYEDNSDVYCAFGYIYMQEQDIDTARNYVNNSLKLDKNNKSALDLLDLINASESKKYSSDILDAIEAQNYKEAMRLVNEAMSIDKKSSDLYFYKSLIYIAQSNYKASTLTLHRCLEISPNYTDAYFYLGGVYENLGETENAIDYYKKFIRMTQGNEIGKSDKIDFAKNRINKLEKI